MIGLAIRRPVATAMAFGCLAAVGLASAGRMPLELLPDVEFPRLEVVTFWPGASPEHVESSVTSPIEAVAQGVRRVRSVRSTSYSERSVVTVEFEPGTDMEFARLELEERLTALGPVLPAGTLRPEVQPWVPDEFAEGRRALVAYTLAGSAMPGALREYAEEELGPRLAAVPDVGAVRVVGGTRRELRVRLDPVRMASLGMTPEAVRGALVAELNVDRAAGKLRRNGLDATLPVEDRAHGLADVEALIVKPRGPGRPAVRLADVAAAAFTYADPTELHRVDGTPAVSLVLHRQPGSNAIRVVDRIRQRVGELTPALPADYRIVEDHDGSRRIREQLSDLRDRALLSAAVVLLVLRTAFDRWRPALLLFGTAGAGILVTLNLMALSGLSLNLLTLAGLAMGLGLMVDNGIVVLESIETARSAPTGARQVVQPVLAATLTTLIVFVPFLYFQGELRAYYVPFAATVGLALLVSLATAFTLIPALHGHLSVSGPWLVTRPTGPPRPVSGPSRRGPSPRDLYRRGMTWTLRHPRPTVGAAFMLLGGSVWLFVEEVPRGRTWAGWDEEAWLSVQITMPRGAELEPTYEVARRVEARLAGFPEVDRFVTRVRAGHASIQVTFPDSLTTTGVPIAVKERLVALAHAFGDAEVRVLGFGPSFYGGRGGPPSYALELKGYDYRELERMAKDLAARLARLPRIRDVDPDAAGHWFEPGRETELVMEPDRDRLSAYGFSVDALLEAVSPHVPGQLARPAVMVGGEEFELSLEVDGAEESDVGDLLDLTLTTDAGGALRLADLATLDERRTLRRIVREDQQYQRIVAYEFRGPKKLGDRVRDAVVQATVLPAGYALEPERPFREYEEGERGQLALVVGLAFLLVYMVTAALFESLRAPLIVLAAVPLALIGVFLLYFYLDETFTREAWIGVVMMTGIVVNNAILVVDRIGALRRGANGPGLPLEAAALRGTLDRVRPVLMTTGSTVLGLLPLVLFTGTGTESLWRALALATIGGLLTSTLLVLLAIPALYVLVMSGRGRA